MNYRLKWLCIGVVATALLGCTTTTKNQFFVVDSESAPLAASKDNVIVVFENHCPISVVAIGPGCPAGYGYGSDTVCRVPEDSATPMKKNVIWKADEEASAQDSFKITFAGGGTGPCQADPNSGGNHKCAIKKTANLVPPPTQEVSLVYKYNVIGTTPGAQCNEIDPIIIIMK